MLVFPYFSKRLSCSEGSNIFVKALIQNGNTRRSFVTRKLTRICTDSCQPLSYALQRKRFLTRSIPLAATSVPDNDSFVPKKKTTISQKKTDKKKEADLAAAFDDFAKEQGFDSSSSFYSDDDTSTDEFTIDVDDDEEINNEVDTMEDRLAAAERGLDFGNVHELDEVDLRELGFRQESEPFGDDETPRKDLFKLSTFPTICSACGSDFQDKNDAKPGFLPKEKYEIQMKLAEIEKTRKVQEAEEEHWTSEEEVDWLIQSEGGNSDTDEVKDVSIQSMAKKLDLDLVKLAEKTVICKRCHGLQNFGEASEQLRPGWTDEPLLSQETFRNLLLPIKDKTCVILALVDLFDFNGSVLPELDAIAGDNPVILAANKADLLPSKMGQVRAESWVRRELEYLSVRSIANVGGAVRLVSCKTGFGVNSMLNKVNDLADEMDCDVYVVGAANAGKSTLINTLLEKNKKFLSSKSKGKKKRAGNVNARKGAITTSPLPGTTLKFIKIELDNGKNLYDTPGLLIAGSMTSILTPAELKMVVPKKQVEPVTFRISSGKCVLVGGLAKIEVIGDSKPFFFSFFVANDIKLHPTDSDRAEDFVAKHAGGILTPPLDPSRMEEIGEFETHDLEIDGCGWKEASADITLRGLGWVSVTGSGTVKVRVSVPKGIGLSVRPPLMPFDIWESTAKYTGGRAVRKSSLSKSGKRRKGVGRR